MKNSEVRIQKSEWRWLVVSALVLAIAWPVLPARNVANGALGDVNFGHHLSWQSAADISVGVWVKIGAGAQTSATIVAYFGPTETEADNVNYGLQIPPGAIPGSWDIQYVHEFSNGTNEIHPFDTNVGNGVWTYIGISRDATAKTVALYRGDGLTLTPIETWGYVNQPTGGTGADVVMRAFTASEDDITIANLSVHNRKMTQAEHYEQMTGKIPRGGLVLWAPLVGASPEPNWSGQGNRTGAVTGTTTVADGPPVMRWR